MKIKQLSETTAGAVASVAMPLGSTHKRTEEAANPAQQAAIAVAMKKAGKKPKNVKEGFSKDEIEAAMKDYLKSGGEVVQGKKSKGPRKSGLSLASKHIGGGGDKMRPSRTGLGSNPMGKVVVAVESEEGYIEINPRSFLDDDFYAFDPETKVLKNSWSYKSVGRRNHEYEAQRRGYEVVSGIRAKNLGLLKKTKVDVNEIDIPEIPRAPTRREEPKPNPKMNEYLETDKGATPPKTPIEKPVDTKPYEEPKDKKDPKSYMDKAVTKESSIFKGVSEAHISEEELLLAPGQGVRYKTELMPKRTDHEVEMAKNQLRTAAQSAKTIYQNIKDLSEIEGLDGWVQAKITKASDYLDAVNNYIEGKKQMLEIQSEVDEQVDAIDQRLTAQYNTPQAKAQSQAIDQAFASGDEKEFQRLGIQSPQQIERDYQTMLAKEPAQDAALMRNPRLTPSARPVQRYNPKGVPIRETDIEETAKLSAREKFKRGLKRAGYDPDAGADRLLNLIARQAEERKEFEKKQKEQDAEFYGRKKDVAEGSRKAWMKHNNLVDLEKPLAGLEAAFNDLLRTHDPKERAKYQQGVKQRIKTQPMSGPKEKLPEQGVAEGSSIDDSIKGKIQNITKELSDVPGYWDWQRDTFTPYGVEALIKALKSNKQYIKYALSLTSDDYFDRDDLEEDWQKTNRRDKTSGMSRKAVKQYRRENPGSKLKTAVTTKPSKLKPGSKAAKRRKSFCARMSGNKGPMKTPKGKPTPKALALRRWNCESVEEMKQLVMIAEQKIAMLKEEQGLEENLHKWFKEKWVRFGPDGKIRGDCARGDDSEGKPKCLPQSKAHSLGKKGRASAGARKRREDPNPERSGKAINVATKKKANEDSKQPNPDAKKNIKSAEEIIRALRPDLPPDYEIKVNKDSSKPPVGGKEQLRKDIQDAGKEVYQNDFYKESSEHEMCPECGGEMYGEEMINEKKDACYYKVKSRYKVWPSAYASGALVKCRNKGAKNWGNKSK